MTLRIETGDFIALIKGTTTVRGQCMGWRIDQSGDVDKIYMDGFDLAFWVGETDWQLLTEEEN